MTLLDLSKLIGIEPDVILEGLNDRENQVSLGLSLNKTFNTNVAYQHEWVTSDYFPQHAIKAIAQYYAPIERKAEAALTFLDCMGV